MSIRLVVFLIIKRRLNFVKLLLSATTALIFRTAALSSFQVIFPVTSVVRTPFIEVFPNKFSYCSTVPKMSCMDPLHLCEGEQSILSGWFWQAFPKQQLNKYNLPRDRHTISTLKYKESFATHFSPDLPRHTKVGFQLAHENRGRISAREQERILAAAGE